MSAMPATSAVMDPGRLDCRVTLCRRTSALDAAGQPLDTWATVATVWANLRWQTGAGAIRADRPTGRAAVSVRIRQRDDVATGMRVVWGSTTLDIESALPQGRDWLDLVCTHIQPPPAA